MKRYRKRSLSALLWLLAGACHAGLGDVPASFASHVASQRSVSIALTTGSTSYRETTLDTGTVVHEYLGSDGRVYAVTWKGPFLPDLKTLLGSSYFTAMTDAASTGNRQGVGGLRIAQPDLVLQAGGHMGAFAGRAWLPPLLPSGLRTDAIQ